MPDFAFSMEALFMATNDLIPLFLSDHTEEPEQPIIGKAWHRAAISSRILKTIILVVTVPEKCTGTDAAGAKCTGTGAASAKYTSTGPARAKCSATGTPAKSRFEG
jgi:hypothetical protein